MMGYCLIGKIEEQLPETIVNCRGAVTFVDDKIFVVSVHIH